MDVHEAAKHATTKSLLCADKNSTLEILYIYTCMCTYEGLGISIMSFPLLDGLFVYVCMREWEGLELLLSGRMVWPQTQPLHCYYSGRIPLGRQDIHTRIGFYLLVVSLGRKWPTLIWSVGLFLLKEGCFQVLCRHSCQNTVTVSVTLNIAMNTHSNFTRMTAQLMQQGQRTNTKAIVRRHT